MSIFLIRHGLTFLNSQGRYMGSIDEPMNEDGIKAIKDRIKSNYYPKADKIYVSPMKRTLQTAELIYPNRDYIIKDELRERDFGKYEGKRYDELSGDREYQRWLNSKGSLPFPSGEQRDDFINRINTIYKVLREDSKDKDIAVVTHGGVVVAFMSIVKNLGRLDFGYGIKNGEWIEI